MPVVDGKVFTLDLVVVVLGVEVRIVGTVEMLDIRKRLPD